jgi:hypothetical protein
MMIKKAPAIGDILNQRKVWRWWKCVADTLDAIKTNSPEMKAAKIGYHRHLFPSFQTVTETSGMLVEFKWRSTSFRECDRTSHLPNPSQIVADNHDRHEAARRDAKKNVLSARPYKSMRLFHAQSRLGPTQGCHTVPQISTYSNINVLYDGQYPHQQLLQHPSCEPLCLEPERRVDLQLLVLWTRWGVGILLAVAIVPLTGGFKASDGVDR